MVQKVSRGFRLHIGFFGRRNVGKSSLLNALTGQDVSIVSEEPGTTTDPVQKAMELRPIGPVLLIDTAGLDDEGALGEARIRRSRRSLDHVDVGILVVAESVWGGLEEKLVQAFRERNVPLVVVLTKCDCALPDAALLRRLAAHPLKTAQVSARTGEGLIDLRQALLESMPEGFMDTRALVGDLVPTGGLALLVVPIDLAAPKGRLILPQVNAIRDLLDHDAACVLAKEHQVRSVLRRLAEPPDLVVTDSQAFAEVSGDTPPDVPLTSFSILFSRFRGDLVTQVQGALAAIRLRADDRVLVAEACTHHPIADDIGRVKIPRWLQQRIGAPLSFTHVQGRSFPDDLSPYRLVIHCGACVWNRRSMLSRIMQCQRAGVPITNYGLVIAHSLDILERALQPFPEALEAYRREAAGCA